MISPTAIEQWRHKQKELLLKLYNEAWAQGVAEYTPLSDPELEAMASEFEALDSPPDFTGQAPSQEQVPPDAGISANPLDVVDAVRKANMGDLTGGLSDLAKASAQDFAAFHLPASLHQHAAAIAQAYAQAASQGPASAIARAHADFIGNVHSAVVHTYSTQQNVSDVKELAKRAFDKLVKPTEPDAVQRAIALQKAYDGVDKMAAQLATLPPPVRDEAVDATADAAHLDTHGLLDFIQKNAWRLDAGDSVAWAGEQNGYGEAADADGQLLAWQTEGDDHVCPDCQTLGGFPPMPLADWPSRPGDGSTQCNVGCRCSLEATPLSVIEGDVYQPKLTEDQQGLVATINDRQAQSLADAMAHVSYLAESEAPREAIGAELARMAEYDDSEARDDHGRWTSGGGFEALKTSPVVLGPDADTVFKGIALDAKPQVERALKDAVARYPSLASGPHPYAGIGFASSSTPPSGVSQENWDTARRLVSEPGTEGITSPYSMGDSSFSVLNDTSPFGNFNPGFAFKSDGEAYGVAMHEIGHAWADSVGIGSADAARAWMEGVGITPRQMVSLGSKYGASDPREAIAELFSMKNSDYGVPSSVRGQFEELMRGATAQLAPPPAKAFDPFAAWFVNDKSPRAAAVNEAAERNLRANAWVATNPLLDWDTALRESSWPLREYDDSEPRDDHGKWTSGGDSSADSAALASNRASLITGKHTEVDAQHAPALIESLKDAPGPVELENLHVDGAGHGNLFDHSATSIDRAHMPQVPGDAEHMAQFQQLLASRGLTYSVDQISPLDLHATQDQLDGRTVGKIAEAYDPNKAGLLVTADDGAILDGHHRWAAGAVFALQNPDYHVGELRVHTDIGTLLKVSYEFDQRSGIKGEAFGAMHEARVAQLWTSWRMQMREAYTRAEDDPKAPIPVAQKTSGQAKPFKVETPTEPPPDPAQPYIWLDGKWHLIATDGDLAPLREATWPLREYSDAEARDEHGRWTSGGGDGSWQRATDDNSADFTAVKYARSNFEVPPRGMYTQGLTDYTNGWSQAVNSSLRSGQPLSAHERSVVSSMDALLGGSHVTADTTVFRGFSNDITAEMHPGDTLIDRGFVSTTLREPIAARYLSGGHEDAPVSGFENKALLAGTTPTLAEIRVPAGSSAYAQDRYETAGFAQVILPRDSGYQMVSSEMVGEGQGAYRHVVFNYQPRR